MKSAKNSILTVLLHGMHSPASRTSSLKKVYIKFLMTLFTLLTLIFPKKKQENQLQLLASILIKNLQKLNTLHHQKLFLMVTLILILRGSGEFRKPKERAQEPLQTTLLLWMFIPNSPLLKVRQSLMI